MSKLPRKSRRFVMTRRCVGLPRDPWSQESSCAAHPAWNLDLADKAELSALLNTLRRKADKGLYCPQVFSIFVPTSAQKPRPLSWSALVRVLRFVPAGLGFLWIAFAKGCRLSFHAVRSLLKTYLSYNCCSYHIRLCLAQAAAALKDRPERTARIAGSSRQTSYCRWIWRAVTRVLLKADSGGITVVLRGVVHALTARN
ncbi:hypothetical protein CONLIGDRAFT_470140 [Coniochaeta ligniaria NRRL 30616]|uniref:Uncharacterized protein n=1 Tax=Coniochaeta ligniaria NRRL 30616 TaxID=1408157 RepID=A0A1J7JFJ3_9PEZI|nr:hypothetical protein CONLIGDRAFT_470140 [Coniochaeta ligniaria NRRL 30616]